MTTTIATTANTYAHTEAHMHKRNPPPHTHTLHHTTSTPPPPYTHTHTPTVGDFDMKGSRLGVAGKFDVCRWIQKQL